MLRRRPIRTKLLVALTVLSAIVLLLAVSGFWGLYQYQRTTRAILLRYDQQLAARQLEKLAESLGKGNDRLLVLLENEPMIGSLSSKNTKISLEKRSFAMDVESFGRALDSYTQLASASTEQSRTIRTAGEERVSFAQVEHAFASVSPFRNESRPAVTRSRQMLGQQVSKLIDRTKDHDLLLESDVKVLMNDLKTHYNTWTTVAWFCTACALSLVGLLLWWLNSLVVKPFRTLLDGSRLVAGGQFDHRIDLGTGDELSELAVAMNEMTDRFQHALNKLNSVCADLDQQVRDRTREVIQNEQLASVGFLAAGVAHEINNPLATIAWSAESLESRVGEITQRPIDQRTVDAELSQCLTENLRRIEEEAFRCKGITEKLLDFSRLGEVRRSPTNLVDLVNDVVSMVSKVGKYRCKTMQVEGAGDVVAHVNSHEIRQVVLNLVTNALESLDTDGAVSIAVHSDGVNASIAITDNGCGMNADVLKHVFEPFFTRRRDGTGTGLGLSITYRIVSQHGGSLTAQSEGEGRGSRMEILLPIEPANNDDASMNANSSSRLTTSAKMIL